MPGATPDDGAPLGCVLHLHGGEATYAYTTTGALRLEGGNSTYAYTTTGALRRLGAGQRLREELLQRCRQTKVRLDHMTGLMQQNEQSHS